MLLSFPLVCVGFPWGKICKKPVFCRKKSTKTSTEINTEKILEIRNDLVNIVLTHADKLKSEAEAQKNKVEALSNQLGKYLPPQIHNAIFSDDYDVGIATKRKKCPERGSLVL